VQFNMYLPTVGPLATPENLVRVALEVEAMGYVHAKMGEHLIYPVARQGHYPYRPDNAFPFDMAERKLETLTTFTYLAARTTRLRFQSSVLILPVHSPFDTAVRVATLDFLSGGRLTLGVGSGWMRDEFDVVGVPFHQRGRVLDEYLAILRTLFEGRGGFEGERYRFPALHFEPKPVQVPFPIHVGGAPVTAVLRRVARFGQGWLPLGPIPEVEAALPRLWGLLADEGRSPEGFEVVGNLRSTEAGASDPDKLLAELEVAHRAGFTAMNVRASEFSLTSIDGFLADLGWFAENVMPEASAW
jgi:probable F420-dependent oxidoreductase